MANNDKRLLLEYGHLYTPTNNDERVMKEEIDNNYDRAQFLMGKQLEFARQAHKNDQLISQHEARSGPYKQTIFNNAKMKTMTNREKEAYLRKQRLESASKARNEMTAKQINALKPLSDIEKKRAELHELGEAIKNKIVIPGRFNRVTGKPMTTSYADYIMSQIDDRDLFKKLIIDDTLSDLKVDNDKFKFIKEYLRLRLKPTAPEDFSKNFEYQILLELSKISDDHELDNFKREQQGIRDQYDSILAESLKKSTGFGAKIKNLFKRKGGSQKTRRQTRRQRKQKKTRKRFHK